MFKIVDTLIKRYFSNEELVVFLLFLIATLCILVFWGGILAPILIAIVLAFLLQGLVDRLQRLGLGHILSVFVVFFTFLTACGVFIGVMVPIIWRQAVRLVQDVPRMFTVIRTEVQQFAAGHSEFVSQNAIDELTNSLANESTNLGQWLVSFSLSSIPSLFSVVIYLVLVPLVMFFLLKDQERILDYLTSWLPKERKMMRNIAHEMNDQIANYIRGKFIEMFVVGVVTYIVFLVFGLKYAELLALLVGLSVLIPYIGAAAVTIPVVLVAFYQYGTQSEFIYVVVAYLIVQALDGNVLVPLLFSEAVNLHPLAIIIAVLFFGGIWGFWGIFFAIPLATLVKAIINAWPNQEQLAL
ncbi:AI-2E family transporter [Marinomonas primoryensis]|jgi:putative permease|uniref:AI-2E family transporter n=1 Tax=Marinomonas primoryensis TaxID=178399 RepID=A0A859D1B8_9GAMM|nr:AI-2E family transporter [Marinomonas primoryensis]QKK80591.1 AI-2E family transporter [Marinomonas primoryensis]|tara:strand:+ start:45959 stop:47020 length:1062 start_codon:yes stop_codon:yes gene_type:complete